MKQRTILASLAVGLMLFCGCGKANIAESADLATQKPASSTEASEATAGVGNAQPDEVQAIAESTAASPAPTQTPEPIPEIRFPDGSIHDLSERRLDLSALSHAEVEDYIEVLRRMTKLRYVDLGEEGTEEQPRDLNWEDVRKLQEGCPETDFRYGFTLFEKHFTTLDEEMNFHHVEMDDEGAAVREVLPCMTKCKTLDMDFSGVSSEAMAKIRDDFPEIEVIWRIWFGTNCSVRTDVERILASNLDHKLQDTNTQDLKYCTKVRLLDIGHNEMLTDFSFLEYMPDLEVAILGISGMRDFHSTAEEPDESGAPESLPAWQPPALGSAEEYDQTETALFRLLYLRPGWSKRRAGSAVSEYRDRLENAYRL